MMLMEAAPAKLNLALHLRRRRADGYHALETIFAFTDFGDVLGGEAAEEISLIVSGDYAEAAGQGGDNLVLKAARALAEAGQVRQGARLTLEKRIPVAAGLGGGSADGAAALRLLNRLWGLNWPEARLLEIAAEIGSDVPACVLSHSVYGEGRGEALRPWPVAMTGVPVLLVNPRVAVPTGPVFAGWDQVDQGPLDPMGPLAKARNDMTASAVQIAPVIGEVLVALDATPGTTLVRMSGSGATCLALYDTAVARDGAAASLAGRGWWAAATHLL